MKLGIMVEGQEDVTWERWLRVVDLAESLGFDSLWRSDHLFSVVGASDRASLALWPSLTAVALRTERIRFGQLVSPVTFRHPVELAQHAVALDHLSGGRYVLGVGAGWYEREHRAFGFALPPARERVERLREALDVIRLLWSGEPVSYQGTHFTLDNAVLRPRPLAPSGVPIMIGGGGEQRTLRLVAAYATEWNPGFIDPDGFRRKDEVLRAYCREIGRDPGTIRRTLMAGYVIGRSENELRARAMRLQEFLTGEQPLYFTRRYEPDEFLAELRRRWWFVGRPGEIVEQLRAWAAAGIDVVMLQTLDLDDTDQIELVAEQVLPFV
ncbi:MAG: LLM class F420-dependent oxidoreductase [Thermomicrobium sp.]|nr:LLM class F420-dependent oxidoreductase [Thermomicrobium sp.]MCS7246427.1 LLM class F420-dependent oxidoreductase [Thermomicrobium sp.]MDW7982969.1 LLM class F420-dependent oxidoreductase [Thermomicrobium sp.]